MSLEKVNKAVILIKYIYYISNETSSNRISIMLWNSLAYLEYLGYDIKEIFTQCQFKHIPYFNESNYIYNNIWNKFNYNINTIYDFFKLEDLKKLNDYLTQLSIIFKLYNTIDCIIDSHPKYILNNKLMEYNLLNSKFKAHYNIDDLKYSSNLFKINNIITGGLLC